MEGYVPRLNIIKLRLVCVIDPILGQFENLSLTLELIIHVKPLFNMNE